MKKLVMTLCASKDSFGAFSENCEGIYASGDTVKETMDDVHEAIRLIKATLPEDRWPDPIKGEYEIEWHLDTQSLLLYYQGIFTNAALERLTGINQKQLWNYANGVSKPRPATRAKIQSSLNRLGRELVALTL